MIKAVRVCRLYNLHGGLFLYPAFVNVRFESPIWKANCINECIITHKAPDEDCNCGLYSVNYALIMIRSCIPIGVTLVNPASTIAADCAIVVECLGKTIKHKGRKTIVYRSEIQVPQAIYIPEQLEVNTSDLSKRYDCEVIRFNEDIKLP